MKKVNEIEGKNYPETFGLFLTTSDATPFFALPTNDAFFITRILQKGPPGRFVGQISRR